MTEVGATETESSTPTYKTNEQSEFDLIDTLLASSQDPRPWCEHQLQPYQLWGDNGSPIIYASAWHDRYYVQREFRPDFAIYFDGAWLPESLAYHIGWIDYSTPTIPIGHVADALDHTLTLLNEGYTVEVGCLGGHGRTGTYLALLNLCQGATPREAIKDVQDHYCYRAVESRDQYAYIKRMDRYLRRS